MPQALKEALGTPLCPNTSSQHSLPSDGARDGLAWILVGLGGTGQCSLVVKTQPLE